MIKFTIRSKNSFGTFIIQKLKSKHNSLKKYTNWAKLIYFSLVLREREEKETKYFAPQNREAEKLQEVGNDRRRKIVEFMLELRKLFALMVSSQRKYVDPSRAVDILRGSIGTLQNENQKDILNIDTNNQQDVSEFTHIVLEWVEEAFKDDTAPLKVS